MYIDREDFIAWMERIMDRFDMQDKKIDKVIKGRNCLDGEELLDNQDLCLLLKVAPPNTDPLSEKGILPFLMLDGRCYYRATDVHKVNPGENRLIFFFSNGFQSCFVVR